MFTFFELGTLLKTEEDAMKLAQESGLIWKDLIFCESDNYGFTRDTSKMRHGIFPVFKCNTRNGSKHRINILKNTILEESHLTISKILKVLYCF